MDNKTAREILAAYRPSGEDATDSTFREALAQSERDPEMRAWFERERAWDHQMAETLESVEVPSAGKLRLLQLSTQGNELPANAKSAPNGARAEARREAIRRFPAVQFGLGLAALLAMALLLWQIVAPPGGLPRSEGLSLGTLVASSMPLSYQHSDPDAVVRWLRDRSAPTAAAFPPGLSSAAVQGCRVFELATGGKISLVCFLNNGELVHLFVFDKQAHESLASTPLNTWWTEQGWHFYSVVDAGQRLALATQGQTTGLM